MKKYKVLITGGAGFIGSFLADELIKAGYFVRIFDSIDSQVHQNRFPTYLNKDAEFVRGDVQDLEEFKKALKDIDVVFNLAASVGVAQSNYQIKKYTSTNIGGVANLLDIIVNEKLPIKKILMTASMTSYGEGEYECAKCGAVRPYLRSVKQLERKDWNIYCPFCGKIVKSTPTSENIETFNNSIYSLSKNVQEQMLMLIGSMYKIPVVSLRCFNVYGPRQSLSNPYTGVSAIFISRLKNNKNPVIYEDGLQTRDFVSVHDVVDALMLAMNEKKADYEVINIGSGEPISIKKLAVLLSRLLKKNIKPVISDDFRINDIRHCYADITKAKKILGWKPKISLSYGLRELIDWSENEEAIDMFGKAEKELRSKKLLSV